MNVTRTVNVTAEDIANGKAKDCSKCPVAIAAQRTFPELYAVEVFAHEIRAFDPPLDRPNYCFHPTTQEHTDEVEAFVHAFDEKQWVQPFSFDLTLSINEAKLSLPLSPE